MVVIVTGGAGDGIDTCSVHGKPSQKGAEMVITDRRRGVSATIADELVRQGQVEGHRLRIRWTCATVRPKGELVDDGAHQVRNDRVTRSSHGAGVAVPGDTAADVDSGGRFCNKIMDVNAQQGVWLGMKAVQGPTIDRSKRSGKICNVASTAAHRSLKKLPPCRCASKGAVR